MTAVPRQLKLALFMNTTEYAWLYEKARSESEFDFAFYRDLAQMAERAKFDAVFLADIVAVNDRNRGIEAAGHMGNAVVYEPLTMLGALSAVTEKIGLVATASTTYHQPFHIARMIGSLDHLSKGRIGWNVVTSQGESEAAAFGLDAQLDANFRYERASEFVDLVFDLWNSWEGDAFLRDKASTRYFDPSKVHPVDHHGQHFKVRGALNVPRPPQGRPVISQAGSSEPGFELAARTADVMFCAPGSLERGKAFSANIRERMVKYGRTPDEVAIMPGLFVVAGGTEEEARRKYADAQAATPDSFKLQSIDRYLGGVGALEWDLDRPIPATAEEGAARLRRRVTFEVDGRRMTARELGDQITSCYGHITCIGAVEQVADTMENWLTERACDGFTLFPHYLPGNAHEFGQLVVPELQRRGIFRRDYEGSTFRDHLGLAAPQHPETDRKVAALAGQ
ncbi:nitrilotriacetate monooxygenase [Mesorhizobium loti]|nr:LLM class flavin-dependent oxidoreductase [Mesorhizobium loti]PLP59095.1 nitrilotriacetate monooxygenase [Mesorhizobium loti]